MDYISKENQNAIVSFLKKYRPNENSNNFGLLSTFNDPFVRLLFITIIETDSKLTKEKDPILYDILNYHIEYLLSIFGMRQCDPDSSKESIKRGNDGAKKTNKRS